MIGLGLENKSQFNIIQTSSNTDTNSMYTNRMHILDMPAVKGTLKISHVPGEFIPNATKHCPQLISLLSYPFTNCHANPTNQMQGYYHFERILKGMWVKENNITSEDEDKYGLSK